MLVLALKFSRCCPGDDKWRPGEGALLGISVWERVGAPRKRNRETIQTFETRPKPVGLSVSSEQAPVTSDQRGSPWLVMATQCDSLERR